jgi:large subunit ribosomal protein L2
MKRYKPTTPGRRGMTAVTTKGVLSTDKPHKSLTKGFKRGSGRNNQGRLTTRHKGGGHKRRFREIDFLYNKKDIKAKITSVEYDPNRSGFISLITFADGEKRYVLTPQGVGVGDTFIVSDGAPLEKANRLPLKKIPVGTFVYNVELKPGGGSKIARGAGSFVQVIAHDQGQAFLKMPSTEVRKVSEEAWACIGEVSNSEYKLVNYGKAGRNRHRGIRPTVRGSAMNPVDHPHGGGEGKQGIGLRRGPKTRQGKLAYGVKTRKKKKYSSIFIVSRRKPKKRKR